ncbi:M20/M25/M40 family metallo-hydrolase [Maridesulfovibrio sp.]|uniref:M20/M25/M40 family metallo-hydrolase n=1 Tax=Maridesulfovibrio sp. TaxID=2795000 RepID=UPI002A18A778|nr:M20/M25/M40 family metallo-hydrolase [Maridesulfovibrio sp.]
MINEERILNLFMNMVRIGSPSLEEKNMAVFLRGLMEQKGYEIHEDCAGDFCGGNTGNLVVRIPGTCKGTPIAFSAHMDCVPPCMGVEPVVADGRVCSAGETVLGGDDKAGIAMMIEAMAHIEEEGIAHPDVYFIFSICEEAGMHGAKNLDSSLLPLKDVVILDASGVPGCVVVEAPAKAVIRMVFKGKASHAGIVPEAGICAIRIAAEAVSAMKLLRIDEKTTANLGKIEGGGATNIVTDTVTLTAEARSSRDELLQDQIEHMRSCCAAAAEKFGGEYVFESAISYPSLHVPDDSPMLRRIELCCNRLGLEFRCIPTGGGSDANVLYGRGYSAVTLGIGMTKVHTCDEYIELKSLTDCAALVAEIIKG